LIFDGQLKQIACRMWWCCTFRV